MAILFPLTFFPPYQLHSLMGVSRELAENTFSSKAILNILTWFFFPSHHFWHQMRWFSFVVVFLSWHQIRGMFYIFASPTLRDQLAVQEFNSIPTLSNWSLPQISQVKGSSSTRLSPLQTAFASPGPLTVLTKYLLINQEF